MINNPDVAAGGMMINTTLSLKLRIAFLAEGICKASLEKRGSELLE
jgi:hypothetical protein